MRTALRTENMDMVHGGTLNEVREDAEFLKKLAVKYYSVPRVAFKKYGVEVDYHLEKDTPNVYKINGVTVTQEEAHNHVLEKLNK